MERYIYGVRCWSETEDGVCWKSRPDAPDVSPEEYEATYGELMKFLDSLPDHRDERGDQRCYFRGDFTGERTQQLEFNDIAALTPRLVHELCELLLRPEYHRWRIWIGSELESETILIYPGAVCTSRILADVEADAEVAEIARRQTARRADAERAREARLARVQPLLRDAYASAKVFPGLAYQVRTERGAGKDERLVWMWVIHTAERHVFDLDECETDPEAVYVEQFFLTSDGILLHALGERPDGSVLLVLWEFEGNDEKTFTLSNGARTLMLQYS